MILTVHRAAPLGQVTGIGGGGGGGGGLSHTPNLPISNALYDYQYSNALYDYN